LPAAVAFEARNVFPFDTDLAQIRHLPAGDVRQGSETRHETIVLAAMNEEVDRFVEQFHGSGAVIQSLDIEPCAAYRSIERFIRRREDEQDVHVLVDVGWRRSTVVIGRGRDIAFIKPIDIGGKQLHEAVARNLGLSHDEAVSLRRRLAETSAVDGARDPVRQAMSDATRSIVEELGREIALCLRYYSVTFRGARPSRMRLVGGESCDSSLLGLLNAALPIPVEAGRPLYSVNTSRMKPADRRGMMSEWTVALGLALKMTTARFGARDGRPRDPNAPREPFTTMPMGNSPSELPAAGLEAMPAVIVPEVPAEISTTPSGARAEGVTHA
jgi:Tfp pilus assembly PilM family ATPase